MGCETCQSGRIQQQEGEDARELVALAMSEAAGARVGLGHMQGGGVRQARANQPAGEGVPLIDVRRRGERQIHVGQGGNDVVLCNQTSHLALRLAYPLGLLDRAIARRPCRVRMGGMQRWRGS